MRPIPKKLRDELNSDPYYSRCCLNNGDCDGRVEWHHTIIYQSRQLQEKWAIGILGKVGAGRLRACNHRTVTSNQ
jgi:hypothetical protein